MRKWHPNEEKNVMKSKLIFFLLPFRLVDSYSNPSPSNTWTLLKLDGVQASRFSSHINRASLSDQNDGICTVIYLLPRLLQLEWEKKSPNKIRSHPKEKQSFKTWVYQESVVSKVCILNYFNFFYYGTVLKVVFKRPHFE